MEQQAFKIEDETLGKEFTVIINRVGLITDLRNLIENHKFGPDSEYPSIGRVDINGYEVTKEARERDLLELQNMITNLTEDDLLTKLVEQIVANQPRKKNSSLAKGRVNNIAQYDSFGSYWEDSYGTNTPAIRARSLDDYRIEVVYEEYIVKY